METRRSTQLAIDLIGVTVLVGWFLHFALKPAPPPYFRGDDMANLFAYWSEGWVKIVSANLRFWTSEGRPLAGLYYLPLHSLFGLDPRPYRIMTVILGSASVPIGYLVARSLSGSRLLAFLATLAWCYHPRMFHLVFTNAFIYDVLCTLFYLAAFGYYVAVREQGKSLRPLQLLGCLALYICALNSKEMAVTFPVMLFAYETLRYYHQSERRTFLRWVRDDAALALIAGLIAGVYAYNRLSAIYSYNKVHGPGSGFDAYTPHFSWSAFTASNAHFFSDLFYLAPHHVIAGAALLSIWGLVFAYAFLRRDRLLELMACWIVITPLPLAFVSVRAPACLGIVLFGWAMVLAKLVLDLAMGVARLLRLGQMPALSVRVGMTFCVAILLGLFTERQTRGLSQRRFDERVMHVIDAFRALNLQPKPGSKILLSNNPFGKRPFPVYIAQLVWNDHSLTVDQEENARLSADETAKIDYILGLAENKIDIIREPH